MNDQLPPVDPHLGRQLARRAAGPMPDGLLAGIATALDGAPRRSRGRALMSTPRSLAAAASLTVVAVLALALVAAPALRPGPTSTAWPLPSGYPVWRALTTQELADVMAGPAPALNTALVAEVTIDARTDVCPMNRYPTIGVIDGTSSQICVMGSGVSGYLTTNQLTSVFAFRYLAPGILGLVGELRRESMSMLAFGVADDWPDNGTAFLVEGWLGATPVSCTAPEVVGVDPLDPYADDPCHQSWLSTDSSPNQVAAWPTASGRALPSLDLLGLQGRARAVQAGGMRRVDGIGTATPVHGTYVVKVVTGPCPGDPPISSRGCAQWRVLALVKSNLTAEPSATVTVASPQATPSAARPVTTPHPGYPTDRALTLSELLTVMSDGALPTNTTLLVYVTMQRKMCAQDPSSDGVIQGAGSEICVKNASLLLPRVTATFAVRFKGPGSLEMVGQIEPASSSKLVFGPHDAWPWGLSEYRTFLVGGYLVPGANGTSILDDPNANVTAHTFQTVVVDEGAGLASNDPSQYGVFVVVAEWFGVPATNGGPEGDGIAFHVVARVADIAVPGAGASPTPSPSTAPSPWAAPTSPAGAMPLGLAGTGGRPLTAAEFSSAWQSDPAHLAGRTVYVKGPVPTGFECWSAGAADASAPPGTCHLAVLDGYVAMEGYWAVNVGSDGRMTVIGEPVLNQVRNQAGLFDYTVDELTADATLKDGDLVIVDAWLVLATPTCDYLATPKPSGCGPFAKLASLATANSPATLGVQQSAYSDFLGTAGDWMTEGPPVHGYFLVSLTGSASGTILAQLAPVSP